MATHEAHSPRVIRRCFLHSWLGLTMTTGWRPLRCWWRTPDSWTRRGHADSTIGPLGRAAPFCGRWRRLLDSDRSPRPHRRRLGWPSRILCVYFAFSLYLLNWETGVCYVYVFTFANVFLFKHYLHQPFTKRRSAFRAAVLIAKRAIVKYMFTSTTRVLRMGQSERGAAHISRVVEFWMFYY